MSETLPVCGEAVSGFGFRPFVLVSDFDICASKLPLVWLCLVAMASPVWADSARVAVRQGNGLYADGNYADAIKRYDTALVDQPGAVQPKFNKANSHYKLDDLGQAIDLYQQVAAESKDMQMVAKAKYNLGDCFFQRGTKQKDSDLQKAVDDMKSSISSWRQVLDIDPKNEKAARNIEVARLTIKDLIDQMKKQQDPKKQDPNQAQNQQQQQQNQQQQSQQNDPNQAQDPNQSKDPNQAQQKAEQKQDKKNQDPNQAKEQEQKQQDQRQAKEQDKQDEVRDATAREILDKEQKDKAQRQILQRGQIQKVDKDW
jgi:Ca-activated chloride channel homolog